MPQKRQQVSGQVTIEYILLLLIIILIVKFVASPMGKVFAQWTRFLVGPHNSAGQGYYGCLMEKGLLPGGPLRGESCPNLNLNFNIAAFSGGGYGGGSYGGGGGYGGGGSYGGGGGSGSSTEGGGSEDGSGGNEDSGNKSVTGNKNSKDSSSSGNKRSGQQSSSSSSGSLSATAGSGSSSGGDEEAYGLDNGAFGSAGQSRKKKRRKRFRNRGQSSEDDQEFSFQTSNNNKRGYRGRRRFRKKRFKGILGQRFFQGEKQEERASSFVLAKGSISGKTHSSDGEDRGLKLKTGEKNSSEKVDDKIEEIDYGKFLKYLFFVAIIIAIVVLIGSQILEFQNAD